MSMNIEERIKERVIELNNEVQQFINERSEYVNDKNYGLMGRLKIETSDDKPFVPPKNESELDSLIFYIDALVFPFENSLHPIDQELFQEIKTELKETYNGLPVKARYGILSEEVGGACGGGGCGGCKGKCE